MNEDEFANGRREKRRKVVIEDKRVSREEGPVDTPEPKQEEPAHQAPQADESSKGKPATEPTRKEPADGEVAAEGGAPNLFDIGIEGFIQYNLSVIAQFAYLYMGLVVNPSSGLLARDLTRAKLCIDVFEFLIDKIRELLPVQEREELNRFASDLKLNFINAASSPSPSPEKPQGE